MKKLTTRFALLLVCMVSLMLLFSWAASDEAVATGQFRNFDAYLEGGFETGPGPGEGDMSALFTVLEEGEGTETGVGFDDFSYSSKLRQNGALVPKTCEGGGNSAVDGTAEMVFADGTIRLRRVNGSACVSVVLVPGEDGEDIPTLFIDLLEEWRIVAGGTGRYKNATGILTRDGLGKRPLEPPDSPFTFTSTFSGIIRLDD